MFEAQKCTDLDTASKATKREGGSDAESVGDGAGEKTENSESSVERGVRGVTRKSIFVNRSRIAKAVESVEHAFL